MYPQQLYVREMMTTLGQGEQIRDFPNMLQDPKERLLAGNLIAEESFETLKALGFSVTVVDGKPVLVDDQTPNLAEAADGLGDLQVVLDGAANRLGLDMQKVFVEVHSSNMSKVGPDGKVNKRESDGKVIKPETYKPADLSRVIGVLRAEAIETIISKNYKALQTLVAQGQELFAVVAADLADEPTVTPAVIQRVVDTKQTDSHPYKLRELTKKLLFLGVNNQVHVDTLATDTAFNQGFVKDFATIAAGTYPLLFSNQIVVPEPPKPVEKAKPAVTTKLTTDLGKTKGKDKPEGGQLTGPAAPPVTTPATPPVPEQTDEHLQYARQVADNEAAAAIAAEAAATTPETPATTDPANPSAPIENDLTPDVNATENK